MRIRIVLFPEILTSKSVEEEEKKRRGRNKVYCYLSSYPCASHEVLPFPGRAVYDPSNLSPPIARRFSGGILLARVKSDGRDRVPA
jgi:hypothetical protein